MIFSPEGPVSTLLADGDLATWPGLVTRCGLLVVS